MKAFGVVLVSAVVVGGVVACSDDTYIATNESLGTGGAAGGGGFAGSSAGSGGSAAGAAGAAGGDGAAGASTGGSDAGDSGTECTAGAKQDLGTCQKCGTSRRTCKADGTWGDPACEDQKECNPGDTSATGCSDPCAEKTCGATCSFGACGKKTGATCLYESGTNWQCCGSQKWQYCSSSCDWFSCASCPSNSSCYTKC